MAEECGIHTMAALNGTCAGGGYELALACEEIILQDDGNSTVSLPETPLLAVLPGTGGLTRVVDKRMVRRDLADVFCTVAEGIKGRRAVEWNLVDRVVPASRFKEFISSRAVEAAQAEAPRGRDDGRPGVVLAPLGGSYDADGVTHRFVTARQDGRLLEITLRGPDAAPPADAEAARETANDWWALRAARELDDVLLDLRFNRPDIGLVVLRTEGDSDAVLAHDAFLDAHRDDWFVYEVLATWKRTLKRLDLTARSFFALMEAGSCFSGTLFELALAADRSYMLDDPDHPVAFALSPLNAGAYPMSNGLTRLQTRFLATPDAVEKALAHDGPFDPPTAASEGLVTLAPDDIE